jgi:type I restriction enzyme S subunit
MDTADQLITENLDIWTSAVKAKSSAGRGASKKQELYGISKLREMIRGLGLSGGLCSPEGTFTKNLDHLLAEARKGYSVAQKRKLKDYKIGSPIISEFGIPENWEWKRVSELCDLQTGATPSRQKPEYFGGNNRWLVSGDINLGVIRDCEGRITDEALSASNCKILPQGTVLIALNGQGKTRASVALLETTAACNQSLVGIMPFDQSLLDPAFLLLALKYRYFEIRDVTGQKQRRGLNMGLVAELSVPVPPIEVQHRIVAKVDELMTLCDQLEKEQESSHDTHDTLVATLLGALTTATADAGQFAQVWQRIQANFDTLFTTESSISKLREMIRGLGLSGGLCSPEGTFTKNLDHLLAEARKGYSVAQKRKLKDYKIGSPIISEFGIPENWEWKRVSELCDLQTGATPSRQKPEYFGGNNRWLVSGDINLGVIRDCEGRITDEALSASNCKILPQGTVLIALNGQGKTRASVALLETTAACNQSLVGIIPFDQSLLDPAFLLLALKYRYFEIRDVTGQKQRRGLNMGLVAELSVPVPPIEVQHRIVAKVDELMALCDQLKASLATAQATQLNLADSLVDAAIQ